MHGLMGLVNWSAVCWAVTFVVGGSGVWALVSPQSFTRLARRSSQWVDSSQLLAILDKRVDVDESLLRHPRAFGAFLLTGLALFLGLLLVRF